MGLCLVTPTDSGNITAAEDKDLSWSKLRTNKFNKLLLSVGSDNVQVFYLKITALIIRQLSEMCVCVCETQSIFDPEHMNSLF